jgi:hypothetical protein
VRLWKPEHERRVGYVWEGRSTCLESVRLDRNFSKSAIRMSDEGQDQT